MVLEADIYYRTADKHGQPALERLTGDTLYIYEWLEFDCYDLVWFFNKYLDNTKPMLVIWLGASYRVVIAQCYWIISDKGKVLSHTNIQHLTADKSRDPNV